MACVGNKKYSAKLAKFVKLVAECGNALIIAVAGRTQSLVSFWLRLRTRRRNPVPLVMLYFALHY